MTAEVLTREGQTHRSVILDYLKSAGVMGAEKDPMGQLAAYLTANHDLFVPDGNGNFKLRKIEPEAGSRPSVEGNPTDPTKDQSGPLFGA